ncbi:DUF6436 domain-containing protein, partial [Alishewanella sp. SMS9]|nr:DUF6436 domain-containing protein [Alishewanella sp. SMS9]
VSSVFLFKFGLNQYGEFDPNQQWTTQPPVLSLTELGLVNNTGWHVVHVLESQCGCSRLAREHADVFSERYQITAQQQSYRSAAELAAANFVLPAVPAVLLFDDGQLVYAGPYASGPMCSTSDSFLTSILARSVQLPGLWLNGEVKACRCLVTPSIK